MDKSSVAEKVEFAPETLLENAKAYRASKRMVDAASTFDSVDDAIAALKSTWDALEIQAETGVGYTPDVSLGFGSDNAAVIAKKLLGRGTTIGATRKAFGNLGK